MDTPPPPAPLPPNPSGDDEERENPFCPAVGSSADGPPNAKTRPPSEVHTDLLPPSQPLGALTTESQGEKRSWSQRVKTLLVGKPRDLGDASVFSHVSLIAFLAWVGLGADGLSSSCYGPAEAYANLNVHRPLAVFLTAAIVLTVFIISTCYRHIIEEFPSGGGGYLVASKLLGRRIGVLSGCALLVDYVLTISVSIAAAGDALFGLLPTAAPAYKFAAECFAVLVLILLNLRGVKESVKILMPIFVVFLLTHVILILGTVGMHLPAIHHVAAGVVGEVHKDLSLPQMGFFGMMALLLHAYSLGSGTYTGIEAVSNSMPVMHEPRVPTAKRTMVYMAFSLAFTAGGLMIAYLLMNIDPQKDVALKGMTMNQVLTEKFVRDSGLHALGLGLPFVFVVLFSEGALLFVAAQAGFIDGPRVLANMAQDSWVPHWFANLSDRLATHNGILLIGAAALGALFYTGGKVSTLVIMYSINVFITFSLSMIGMCRHWIAQRNCSPFWKRRLALFTGGAVLCAAILCVTVIEKFDEGGWKTLAVTGLCVAICFLVYRYYKRVAGRLRRLDETLMHLEAVGPLNTAEPDPALPTAVVLVGGYSGLGIHTMLGAVRFLPNYYRSYVFVSVGVIDSGNFKGAGAVEALHRHTAEQLEQYVQLAQRLGMPARAYLTVGTDIVDELEKKCLQVARDFPKATFFAGQMIFQKDTWLRRWLHNQTAYSLQRRLQWAGYPMVILPTRVR